MSTYYTRLTIPRLTVKPFTVTLTGSCCKNSAWKHLEDLLVIIREITENVKENWENNINFNIYSIKQKKQRRDDTVFTIKRRHRWQSYKQKAGVFDWHLPVAVLHANSGGRRDTLSCLSCHFRARGGKTWEKMPTRCLSVTSTTL